MCVLSHAGWASWKGNIRIMVTEVTDRQLLHGLSVSRKESHPEESCWELAVCGTQIDQEMC